MRLAWFTDVHFETLEYETAAAYLEATGKLPFDAALLGGDIGKGPSTFKYLELATRIWKRPIYFVLGNHDFYVSSLKATHEKMSAWSNAHASTKYLPVLEPKELGPGCVLIGQNGWGDARIGSPETSKARMNDWVYIEEFAGLGSKARIEFLRQQGDQAAAALEAQLLKVIDKYSKILLLTHVPPFEVQGAGKEDESPFYCCVAMGEVIRKIMSAHPEKRMLLLSGHVHFSSAQQVLPNVLQVTAHAKYSGPCQPRVFEVTDEIFEKGLG